MADYTSIVSVRSYLPAGNRVDELTKPSLTEVLAWIAQSTGMANAALAQSLARSTRAASGASAGGTGGGSLATS